jgi:hypothetical protein
VLGVFVSGTVEGPEGGDSVELTWSRLTDGVGGLEAIDEAEDVLLLPSDSCVGNGVGNGRS